MKALLQRELVRWRFDADIGPTRTFVLTGAASAVFFPFVYDALWIIAFQTLGLASFVTLLSNGRRIAGLLSDKARWTIVVTMLCFSLISVVVYLWSVESYILAMIIIVLLTYVLGVVGALLLIVMELLQATRRYGPANNG